MQRATCNNNHDMDSSLFNQQHYQLSSSHFKCFVTDLCQNCYSFRFPYMGGDWGFVNVEVAEALAILEGGLSFSRFEVDNVIQDIKDFLDNQGNFEVQFAPRSCNKAAHGVAKWALSGFGSIDSFDVHNSILRSSFFLVGFVL
ncbi:hypothetical protein EZV62_002904 [Acer yangbiense]|uniref:RNase H type-1 domain-containing protein n=1 Tax=Acer yangbiense TaxID=1000413 RepID=A0A5C7IYI2_9ROSI|nr:hypothetical protein EZV62_002904 [Acer yangbiense]